jgi:hypothetical protein
LLGKALADPQHGHRRMAPTLLFATSSAALARNIGKRATDVVLQFLADSGHNIVEVPDRVSWKAAAAIVHAAIGHSTKGIVLLGGYDVIPSQRLDVLPKDLRRALPDPRRDADSFIVWSDDFYGDLDGKTVATVPVSRIPDARSAELVHAALKITVKPIRMSGFGIRNIHRPFANNMFARLPGKPAVVTSLPVTAKSLGDLKDKSALYFMLHGSKNDGTRFWGETATGDYLEAFSVANITGARRGIAFSGCCWGALIVREAASLGSMHPPTSRKISESIALSILRAGATAFVGCTGSHYSPTISPYAYYGAPLHLSFWNQIVGGAPPSLALLEAKKEYAKDFPHGRSNVLDRAVELKILRQFTCLGLGW